MNRTDLQIIIRQETPADREAVHDVVRAAFGQADEAILVDRLRQNDAAFIPALSLVATVGSEIVGHILFTTIRIIEGNGTASPSLALAPVSVAPTYQRRGIGGMLIARGLETATQSGYTSVIVLGHADYYPRFGFAPARQWNIKAPFDVPDTAFMALELVAGGLTGVNGTVAYPVEFAS